MLDDPSSYDGSSVDDATDIGTAPAPGPMPTAGGSPAPPTAKPTFFKGLVTALGMALAQGTKAGVTAPMNAQGPPIAAQTAIDAPQRAIETQQRNTAATTSEQLQKASLALTQISIHRMEMMLMHETEDRQNAGFIQGQKFAETLLTKDKNNLIYKGPKSAAQQLYIQKQIDAKAAGADPPSYLLLPDPEASATDKDPESIIIEVNGKLEHDVDETWGASTLSKGGETITPQMLKDAGIPSFPFHAGAGMNKIEYSRYKTNTFEKWWTTTANKLAAYQKQVLSDTDKAAEGQKNRDLRWGVARLNAETQKTKAAITNATKADDKEFLQALNERKTHIDKLSTLELQSNKVSGWIDLDGRVKSAIKREQAAINESDVRIKEIAGKRVQTNQAAQSGPKIATPNLITQWAQKNGVTDPKAIAEGMKKEGYTFPKKQQ